MINRNNGTQLFDPPSGLIKVASITASDNATFSVQLTDAPAIKGKQRPVPIPAAYPLADSAGLFIGSLPAKNTPITIQQELGGQYHFVSYEPENENILPDLLPGQLLIRSTDNAQISLDLDSHLRLGSDTSQIHIFTGSKQFPKSNFVSFNFDNENHFTQSSRHISGVIRRDLKPNPLAASYNGSTKLEDDSYENSMIMIGMDPTSTCNNVVAGPTKNPPFVEDRKIVYEFQFQSDIDSDTLEAVKYTTSSTQNTDSFTTPNRRTSRADTLSLTLLSPNYLIENIQGTVVDIFGNILDLNRMPLPVGTSSDSTFRNSQNASQSFLNIKSLERKSVAFHFELNARKDLHPTNQGDELSINDDNYNAKLQRSRFFFDIDKEGQFKLNVPASSENGNIALLVRPENYSSFATTDSGNPNQLWFTSSGQSVSQDIYVDSFASPMTDASDTQQGFKSDFPHGSIQLIDGTTQADVGPVDRLTNTSIRHGVVYHDILQTCIAQRTSAGLDYPTGAVDNVDLSYLSTDPPTNAPVAQSKIIVSGTGANAGGRSGSLSFDGSIDLNFGANTSDRQSLWLDTAGGNVINMGRDLNQRSLMMNMNGHAFIQIGGYGITNSDARFSSLGLDGLVDGILDIRVFNSGYFHIIRIDSQGCAIMTPGRMGIHAGQGLKLTSDGDIEIDCETFIAQGRVFNKIFGGSS